MRLGGNFCPLLGVPRREPGIAPRGGVDDGQLEAIGLSHEVLIDRTSPDDVHIAVVTRAIHSDLDRILRSCCVLDTISSVVGIAAQNDVGASQQWLSDRFESRPAHDHWPTHRQALETCHVGGNRPWQFPVDADDAVAANGGDEDDQTATMPLMAGCGS